RHSIP
ncbi:short chain dehydrogenase family protein, partial [Vibrio parahaemolyticus V-223/04]